MRRIIGAAFIAALVLFSVIALASGVYGEDSLSLKGKFVYVMGDRDGIPANPIAECVKDAGGTIAGSGEYLFDSESDDFMSSGDQQNISALYKKYKGDFVIIVGCIDSDGTEKVHKMETSIDPSLANVTYHVMEDQVKAQIPGNTWDNQISIYEEIFDGSASDTIKKYRNSTENLTGTAYAVFNSGTGELDFIRSTENHKNGDTGTVKSISGGSYTGTIYTGFEENRIDYNNFNNRPPWGSKLKEIKQINFIDTISPYTTSAWFAELENCKSINLTKLQTSNVKSMSIMFYRCKELTSLDVSNFDTSKVTDMANMFTSCKNLTSLNLKSFNTSNVTSMFHMFQGCEKLSSIDLSNFNTSKVTNMSYMFAYCSNLTSVNVSNFDTSEVTDMHAMFDECGSLKSLNLNNFNTSKVTDMSYMFAYCNNLTSVNVSNFDTSEVTNMTRMFYVCEKITDLDLSSFNPSNTTDMFEMFRYTALARVNIGENFKVPTNAEKVFPTPQNTYSGKASTGRWGLDSETAKKSYSASELATIGTTAGALKGTWYAQEKPVIAYAVFNSITRELDFIKSNETFSNGSNGTIKDSNGNSYNGIIYTGFEENTNSYSYDQGKTPPPWSNIRTQIKTIKVLCSLSPSTTASWFQGMNNCTSIDFGNSFDTAKVLDMTHMFEGCSSLTSVDMENFDTSHVTDMGYMFNQCSSLKTVRIDPDKFDTGNVTSMYSMFNECSKLESLDVSRWNTSKVRYLNSTFRKCSSLKTLDVSGWDTGNVVSMFGTFQENSNVSALDVSKWNTSNVTNMNYLFNKCSSLKELDVSRWDTSKVTQFSGIFTDDTGLTTINVSKWNTGNVQNISYLVAGCINLKTFDVSGWNTSKVTNALGAFSRCRSLSVINVSGWKTNNLTNASNIFNGCQSAKVLDVSNWNTTKITNMQYAFANCKALTELDVSGFDTSKVTKMDYMFMGDTGLTRIKFGEKFKVTANSKGVFPAPVKTYSGKNSTGKWGPDTETASTTYSPDQLASLGESSGELTGMWYAQYDDPPAILPEAGGKGVITIGLVSAFCILAYAEREILKKRKEVR